MWYDVVCKVERAILRCFGCIDIGYQNQKTYDKTTFLGSGMGQGIGDSL